MIGGMALADQARPYVLTMDGGEAVWLVWFGRRIRIPMTQEFAAKMSLRNYEGLMYLAAWMAEEAERAS